MIVVVVVALVAALSASKGAFIPGDTPEVALAKVAHFAEHIKERARLARPSYGPQDSQFPSALTPGTSGELGQYTGSSQGGVASGTLANQALAIPTVPLPPRTAFPQPGGGSPSDLAQVTYLANKPTAQKPEYPQVPEGTGGMPCQELPNMPTGEEPEYPQPPEGVDGMPFEPQYPEETFDGMQIQEPNMPAEPQYPNFPEGAPEKEGAPSGMPEFSGNNQVFQKPVIPQKPGFAFLQSRPQVPTGVAAGVPFREPNYSGNIPEIHEPLYPESASALSATPPCFSSKPSIQGPVKPHVPEGGAASNLQANHQINRAKESAVTAAIAGASASVGIGYPYFDFYKSLIDYYASIPNLPVNH